jgi:DNA-binding MarR family transcriptional regulator
MSTFPTKTGRTKTGQIKSRKAAVAPDSKLKLRLWLRLLRTSRGIEGELRERLRVEFDVTLPQFDVMAALARLGPPSDPSQSDAVASMTMSELSRFLMVSNGNVTGIIDRLVTDGLVNRTVKPGDRRMGLVRLTTAGAARFDTLALAHEGWVAELLSDLDPDDAEQMIALLGAVNVSKIKKGERV